MVVLPPVAAPDGVTASVVTFAARGSVSSRNRNSSIAKYPPLTVTCEAMLE